MASRVAVLLLAVLCEALEPEECNLLQVHREADKEAEGSNESMNASAKALEEFLQNIPSGPLDDVQDLSAEEWTVSHRALLCASTTYDPPGKTKRCGRILKEAGLFFY